jgi:hypothetical protein
LILRLILFVCRSYPCARSRSEHVGQQRSTFDAAICLMYLWQMMVAQRALQEIGPSRA